MNIYIYSSKAASQIILTHLQQHSRRFTAIIKEDKSGEITAIITMIITAQTQPPFKLFNIENIMNRKVKENRRKKKNLTSRVRVKI